MNQKTFYTIRHGQHFVVDFEHGANYGDFTCELSRNVADADKFATRVQADRLKKILGRGYRVFLFSA